MKAIRLHRQGGPEQLVYEDAPKPELGEGDALIRVRATGITPAELTWAETYMNCDGSERLPSIPGHEVSGVVESVAEGVVGVTAGDEVYALTSFWPARVDPRSGRWGWSLRCSNRSLARGLRDRHGFRGKPRLPAPPGSE
jgi:NADPH:quinone reductase-like Zn-dependent oxidoreductase